MDGFPAIRVSRLYELHDLSKAFRAVVDGILEITGLACLRAGVVDSDVAIKGRVHMLPEQPYM